MHVAEPFMISVSQHKGHVCDPVKMKIINIGFVLFMPCSPQACLFVWTKSAVTHIS